MRFKILDEKIEIAHKNIDTRKKIVVGKLSLDMLNNVISEAITAKNPKEYFAKSNIVANMSVTPIGDGRTERTNANSRRQN
ncbi:hypothetical protein AGMMS50243_08220 [Betaproteobacteria bacterium]|nr:hypothetical protein AGMMS50243_08220 [Betaproteobacteria bacterium]